MRVLVTAAIVTAALLALPAAAAAQGGENAERPNIVVVMTDDQTLDSLRFMPRTLAQVGREGTTFERSFVNFALCCPSRATLFTGQYAHNHGVLGNEPPAGGYEKLDKTNWLPLWLQRAGYRTMHVGKFLNGYRSELQPEVPPGWNDWHGFVDPSTYRFYDYTVNENGNLRTYGAGREPDLHQTDFTTRRANELIAAAAPSPQPFFLSLAYTAPHHGGPREPDDPEGLQTPAIAPRHRDAFAAFPLPLPPSFNEADVLDKHENVRNRPLLSPARITAIQEAYQQRLESLLAVDEGVGSVLRGLRAAGELGNTLVVFTSDNGFFAGEHRLGTGKVLPYEPALRVPLLMRGPGVPAGAVRRQLVTNADLAPTILEAAGAVPGRVLDGRSLFNLLRDPRAQWGRELLIEGGNGRSPRLQFAGLRNYRFSYVEHTSGERELYDLELDPFELGSLHADPAYADVRAGLSRRLATMRRCAGAGCRAKPDLYLNTRAVPRRGRCRLRVGIGGGALRLVERLELRAGPRRVALDSARPFRAAIRRPRRTLELRALVKLADGRAVALDRLLLGCRS